MWNTPAVWVAVLLWLTPQIKPEVMEINPRPYDPDFGVGYSIVEPNFVYPQEFLSLESIDFRNLVVHTFQTNHRHLVCGQLRDGYWEGIEENHANIDTLRWRGHRLLKSESDGEAYILAFFDYWGAGGSSDSDGYAQVWRLRDRKLAIVQQVQFNMHFDADKRGRDFDSERQSLRVLASHYLPGDAHCCISAFDELTFQWDGRHFELVKKETKRNPR